MKLSHWEHSHLTQRRNVIIIGAGIVGLNAAIELATKRPEWHITILERSVYGCAASTRNAGFACFGTVSEIVNDIKEYGATQVSELIAMRRSGLQYLLSQYGVNSLGFVQCGGHEVFTEEPMADRYIDQIDSVNSLLGENLFYKKEKKEKHRIHQYMISNDQEAYLDTGKLYHTLLQEAQRKGVEIIKGIAVEALDRQTVTINLRHEHIDMHAEQVIIASNAFASQLIPQVDVQAVRNQVLVTRSIPDHELSGTYHSDHGYIYFRDLGSRILIGGARNHFTSEATAQFGTNEDNLQHLIRFLQQYFLPSKYSDTEPNSLIERSWSGILTGGSDRLPIIRRISDHQVIAVRLGGMGVAIGSEIGQQAARLIIH